MSFQKICVALVLGSLAVPVAPVTASAAATPRATCEAGLDDLDAVRVAFAQMKDAVSANARHREQLRRESATLAATVARLRERGASPSELERSIGHREAARRELATAQRIRPALESQLRALAMEVDRAERGYIACVEARLDA